VRFAEFEGKARERDEDGKLLALVPVCSDMNLSCGHNSSAALTTFTSILMLALVRLSISSRYDASAVKAVGKISIDDIVRK
jgi:hypothetical protein